MAAITKMVMIIGLACIVLEACVLGFQIYRWNEIIGAIFSIAVSFIGYLPASLGREREKWFICFYSILLVFDLTFQLVNMVLLICFQWVVIQFCIHLNVSVDISDYGGVACNDWWHFGYGEINFRDRAMIVTILLAAVVILRLVQIILSLVTYQTQNLPKQAFYITREFKENNGSRFSGRRELVAQV